MSVFLCLALAGVILVCCAGYLWHQSPGATRRRTALRQQEQRIAAAFRDLLENPID
jgi:hypothetical protein